ncbi:MAG: DUF6512 family protein [bacterium]
MSLELTLILTFFLVGIPSTLLHFTHEWFKNGILLHTFSAVNESTWEHMKLYVGPTLLAFIFQFLILNGRYMNIGNSVLVLMIIELVGVPLMYEPLRLTMKKVPFWITIAIFYIAIILGLIAQYFIYTNMTFYIPDILAIILLIAIPIVFGIFTFYPPKATIFKDPISKTYGDKL